MGDARVNVESAEAGLRVVEAGSEPLDLLRAACAAVWEFTDERPDLQIDPAPLLDALHGLEEAGPWER